MKKHLRILVLAALGIMVAGSLALAAGEWQIFNGNVVPEQAGFRDVRGDSYLPVVENAAGAEDGLALVFHELDKSQRSMWGISFGDDLDLSDGITIVWRSKQVPGANADISMEVRVHTGYRTIVRVEPRRAKVDPIGSGDFADNYDTSDWLTFRLALEGPNVWLYVNEDPVPLVEGTTDKLAAGNELWFGEDSQGNRNIGGMVDWISWNLTGAYSPTQLPLP